MEIALLLSASVAGAQSNYGKAITGTSAASADDAKPTNILFIIMDDVGIDQLTIFGYGGVDAPKTPNIDAICACWRSLPQCMGHARVLPEPGGIL